MITVIYLQIELLLLIALGVYLRRRGTITSDGHKALSVVLTDVLLPANVLVAFLGDADLSSNFGKNFVFMLVMSILVHFFGMFLGMIVYGKEPVERKNIMVFGMYCGNIGYVGIPLINSLYGAVGVIYLSVFSIVTRVLMWTLGFMMMSMEDKFDLKKLLHPCLIAVAIGLVLMFTGLRIPEILGEPIKMLSNCTTGLSMLVIGASIAGISREDILDKKAFGYAMLRTLALPAFALVLVLLMPCDVLVKQVLLASAALPMASTVGVLAKQFDRDDAFAGKLIMLSTGMAMIVMPFVAMVCGML